MGEDGEPRCGGQDCKGVITQTNNAWKKAKDLDKDIMDSLKEVEKLQRMVCVNYRANLKQMDYRKRLFIYKVNLFNRKLETLSIL